MPGFLYGLAAVERAAQRVDHAAEQALAHRRADDGAGTDNLVSRADGAGIVKEDAADPVGGSIGTFDLYTADITTRSGDERGHPCIRQDIDPGLGGRVGQCADQFGAGL